MLNREKRADVVVWKMPNFSAAQLTLARKNAEEKERGINLISDLGQLTLSSTQFTQNRTRTATVLVLRAKKKKRIYPICSANRLFRLAVRCCDLECFDGVEARPGTRR